MLTERLLLLALLLAPLTASAHRTPPGRSATLQVDDRGVTMLVEVSVRGAEAALLFAAHDVDRNGALSEAEGASLARALVAKGARDLELTVGDGRVALMSFEAKIGEASAAQVQAMGLLSYGEALPRGVHEVVLVTGRRRGPLTVVVQTLGGWRVLHVSRGRVAEDGRGMRESVVVGEGERIGVRVGR